MSDAITESEVTAEETELFDLDERDVLLEILALALRSPERPLSAAIDLVQKLERTDLLMAAQELQEIVDDESIEVVNEGETPA